MVFCSLCKQNKETTYNWEILDHSVEGKRARYKICDECAVFLLREMSRKVMGIRDPQNMPNPLALSKTGVIKDILLNDDNSLDIVIDLDICKARRWILRQEREKEQEE